jgi:hypothetical protein
MSVRTFTRPRRLEEESKPLFSDKDYYKTALTGEGERPSGRTLDPRAVPERADPQDRSMHRGRLIPAYWDLFGSIAARSSSRFRSRR